MVAALTTSIPEYTDSGRNWDYRFCWMRDTYFVLQTLNDLGSTTQLHHYVRFVRNVVDATCSDGSKDMPPLFGIIMQSELPERVVSSLAGYRRMGPVRDGNAAYTQIQNDSYGSIILTCTHFFFDRRMDGTLEDHLGLYQSLSLLGLKALECYDKPDAGPWELRLTSQVHTYSVLMCWCACDRLSYIADKLDIKEEAKRWRAGAARIAEALNNNAWSEKHQSFVSTFGGNEVDATLLLMPEVGFIDYNDPRFLTTLARTEKELRDGPHMFRYKYKDDFGHPEVREQCNASARLTAFI
jgi:GH15 family glucan-1,4-alpha-glucosidase